jgi:uncharacterized protein YjbI with pentapeptide repeats
MDQRAYQPNPFFRLPGSPSEMDQDALFDHLSRSDHLRDSLYRPDVLEPPNPRFVTKIDNKTFERVSFTKTTIRHLRFLRCTFKNCLFVGSTLEDCEFHGCQFVIRTHIRSNLCEPISIHAHLRNALIPKNIKTSAFICTKL